MKIKLEKEEYADYIRSISSVFLKLLEMIIKKTQIVDLISLIRFDKKSDSVWVKETNKYVNSFDYIAIIDENGKGGIDLNIKKIIYKRGSFYIQLFKFILQLTTAIGLTVVIYLAAYVLFFLGYFVLILRKGDMKREFHIPGGRTVKLVVAAVGLFMTVVTLVISFFPSSKLTAADNRVYQIVLIVCFIVSMAAPLIIYSNRHRLSSNGKATGDEK